MRKACQGHVIARSPCITHAKSVTINNCGGAFRDAGERAGNGIQAIVVDDAKHISHLRRSCAERHVQRPAERDWAIHINAIELGADARSEEHTSELQSRRDLVCRLLLEKKKKDI